MNELYAIILKYGIGTKFRKALLVAALFLVLFHTIALVAPFLKVFTKGHVQHLRAFSDSISNISVAIILILLVVEGQQSIRSMVIAKRRQNYKDIGNQIVKWLSHTGSQTFEPWVVDSETTEEREILRNFKVIGNYVKLTEYFGYPEQYIKLIEAYCKKVHFEFTSYERKIIYGIHFEFYDRELNERLYERLNDELALSRQSVEFRIYQELITRITSLLQGVTSLDDVALAKS